MKKWIFLGLALFLGLGVAGQVRADGMVIFPPTKPVYETGQKAVIWWDGKKETLILSVTFKGNAEDFAWVIPVPAKPDVNAGEDELFTALDDLTRPKYETRTPAYGMLDVNLKQEAIAPSVTVLETKKVDIYDIAVLEATEGKALREWLTKNGYDYPTNRDLLLQYYVDKNWYFVAAKVSTEALGYVGTELKEGHATPLSISFDSAGIIYPLKISGPGSKYNEADKVAAFGFEQGTESWIARSRIQLTGGEYHSTGMAISRNWSKFGNASLMLSNTSAVADTDYAYRSITGLKPGQKYVYSAYVYGENLPDVKVKLRVSENGTYIVDIPAVSLGTGKEGKRLEASFTTNTSTVKVEVLAQGLEKDEAVYWDGVQLETGTAPTGFAEEVIPESGAIINANQNIGVLLYVFSAKHKQTVPGFSTEYAGYVPAKNIEKLAYNDDGTPWMKSSKNMYRTKMTRNMTQAQMTDDLVIRDANDNDTVGGGESTGG